MSCRLVRRLLKPLFISASLLKPYDVRLRPEHRETSCLRFQTTTHFDLAARTDLDGLRGYVGYPAQELPPGRCVRVSWYPAPCSVCLRLQCSDFRPHSYDLIGLALPLAARWSCPVSIELRRGLVSTHRSYFLGYTKVSASPKGVSSSHLTRTQMIR